MPLLLLLLLLPLPRYPPMCSSRRPSGVSTSRRVRACRTKARSPPTHPDPYPTPPNQPASSSHPFGYTAVLVVPTGVGAAIGGYAGDALPVARGLASVADTLVTHPNVMNGASLYWPQDNILYTEGYALDEFAGGRWGLRPFAGGSGGHRIGLVLDRAMEEDMRLRHLQVGK